MRSYILFLLLIKLSSCIENANEHSIDLSCHLLETSFNSEIFQREFFSCKKNFNTIHFYDLDNQISACNQDLFICDKKVIAFETNSKEHKKVNDILLYKTENINTKPKLYFWRPYSGAVVIFTFQIEDGPKVSISEYEIGSF
jgi:hypothetical protein